MAKRVSTIAELSCRAYNGLQNLGLPPNATRRDVAMLFPDLWIAASPQNETTLSNFTRGKNFGRKSLAEVLQWLLKKPGERRTLAPRLRKESA